MNQRRSAKVFWFFSLEKNTKVSSFSEEKEAKRLLFFKLSRLGLAASLWRFDGDTTVSSIFLFERRNQKTFVTLVSASGYVATAK